MTWSNFVRLRRLSNQLTAMERWQKCHCCYSAEKLEILSGPEFDAYTLICNHQGRENDSTQIITCLRCREFLNKVWQFSISPNYGHETIHNNLDIKPHKVDLILKSTIDEKSPQIAIKSELIDEYNEIDEINVQIKKTQADSSETAPEKHSALNIKKCEIQLHFSDNYAEKNLIIERHNKRKEITETLIDKCDETIADSAEGIQGEFNSTKPDIYLNERPYGCDYCNYRAKTKARIVAHTRRHLDKQNKRFECSICSFKSISRYELNCHTLKHDDEKLFACDHCGYRAKMKKRIYTHIIRHMNKESDKIYKCNQCSFKSLTRSELKRHAAFKHCDERPFSCEECNFRFKFKYQLVTHKKVHLKDNDKPYKCNECSFKTIALYSLKKHIAFKHSDEKPFSCDQCNYRCKFEYILIQHKKIHLKDCDKPYKCSQCSFKTTSSENLKSHVAYKHSDEKPFSCDQCNYRSKRNSRLIAHKNTHLKDKPYKCSECSYVAINRGDLKCHVASDHNDERPFPCDQCNYRCKKESRLSIHKKIHLKDCDKPYRCAECSYKSITVDSLKSHVACKHRDERPFSCDQCDYRCKIKSNLTRHKIMHLKHCDRALQMQ